MSEKQENNDNYRGWMEIMEKAFEEMKPSTNWSIFIFCGCLGSIRVSVLLLKWIMLTKTGNSLQFWIYFVAFCLWIISAVPNALHYGAWLFYTLLSENARLATNFSKLSQVFLSLLRLLSAENSRRRRSRQVGFHLTNKSSTDRTRDQLPI